MQKQDSEKIGVISINSISDVATASEREKKCISRREGDADTRFTLAVSAASEDPKIRSDITSVSILVQNTSRNRRLIYGRSTRKKLRRVRHTGEEILRYI